MNRLPFSTILLITAALAACETAPRPPEAAAGPDSTMVVASGSRVPSDAPAPAEEGPRVVFLGTSLTAGYGLDDPADGFVEQVARLASSAGTPIRAVNAGISGDTSAGGLRRIDWLARDRMDVLVVELGANDGLRGQDPAATEGNLVEIIRRARAAHPSVEVVLAAMEAPTNLGAAYTEAFRAVFPRVAEKTGSTLLPFLLEGVAGVDSLNQEDRIHPTAEGHVMIAATVWEILAPVARSLSGAAGS